MKRFDDRFGDVDFRLGPFYFVFQPLEQISRRAERLSLPYERRSVFFKQRIVFCRKEGIFYGFEFFAHASEDKPCVQLLFLFRTEEEILYFGDQLLGGRPRDVIAIFESNRLDVEFIERLGHRLNFLSSAFVRDGGLNIFPKSRKHGIEFSSTGAAIGLIFQKHRFGNLFSDFYNRVEAGKRVLENHSDFIAAKLVHFLFGHFQKVLPVIENFPALNNSVPRKNPHDRAAGNGFSGAGFSYDRKGFTLIKIERNISHGLNSSVYGTERDNEIFNLQFLFHNLSPPRREAKG